MQTVSPLPAYKMAIDQAFNDENLTMIMGLGKEMKDSFPKGPGLDFMVNYARAAYRVLEDRLDPIDVPAKKAPADHAIEDGTYTVEWVGGDYRTIRIQTQANDAHFAPGKTIASYLYGPDNYANYRGFAFVDPVKGTFNLYKKFASDHVDTDPIVLALRVLLSGRDAMIEGLKAYGHKSGRCGCCGKKLTVPESIKLGIGPVCAARLGL